MKFFKGANRDMSDDIIKIVDEKDIEEITSLSGTYMKNEEGKLEEIYDTEEYVSVTKNCSFTANSAGIQGHGKIEKGTYFDDDGEDEDFRYHETFPGVIGHDGSNLQMFSFEIDTELDIEILKRDLFKNEYDAQQGQKELIKIKIDDKEKYAIYIHRSAYANDIFDTLEIITNCDAEDILEEETFEMQLDEEF